jgi:hypothetical protein
MPVESPAGWWWNRWPNGVECARSRIKPVLQPANAPNLNLIEQLWNFLKKPVLYNRYYEMVDDSRAKVFFGRGFICAHPGASHAS